MFLDVYGKKARFDDTEVPSLPRSIGWIDVRRDEDRAIETLVALLAAKRTGAAPLPTPVKRRRVLLLGSGALLAAAAGDLLRGQPDRAC